MNAEVNDMSELERKLEKRFEDCCERDGWLASAGIAIDTTTAGLVLEKFAESPIETESIEKAQGLVLSFVKNELGKETKPAIHGEEIPTTRAPYHVTIRAEVDVAEWIGKQS